MILVLIVISFKKFHLNCVLLKLTAFKSAMETNANRLATTHLNSIIASPSALCASTGSDWNNRLYISISLYDPFMNEEHLSISRNICNESTHKRFSSNEQF